MYVSIFELGPDFLVLSGEGEEGDERRERATRGGNEKNIKMCVKL